jgi:hypothetical protein
MKKSLLSFLACIIGAVSISGIAQAGSVATYSYSTTSSSGQTVITGYESPTSLCMMSGIGGQFGDSPGVNNIWISQNPSSGTWEMGGSATPSGFAGTFIQASCVNQSAFSGANFNHLYVTTQFATSAFWGGTTVTNAYSFPSGGPWYCGTTALGGDFTQTNEVAASNNHDLGANPNAKLTCSSTSPASNEMGTWCFQFRDSSNNPITPHTVTNYTGGPNTETNLPNSSTAFCFLSSVGGAFQSTSNYAMMFDLAGEGTDQTLVVTPSSSGATMTCIDFNLAD